MKKIRVFWMEIHPPELAKLEESLLKDCYELVRPQSRTDHEEHLRLISDAEYVIVGGIPLTRDLIAAGKRLKLICKYGVGLDLIDLEAAKEYNIPVARAAGSNAIPVAEHAIALMLAVNKKIPYCDSAMRDGKWVKREMRNVCYMLNKKRIGLVGCGNVGRNVAQRLSGFDVEVVYYDIFPMKPEVEQQYNIRFMDLDELVRTSDVISIHALLTDSTRHMFNYDMFCRMKPTAILINTSRGALVCEQDLIRALKENKIRGAGLDVFEIEQPHDAGSELYRLENVVVTPHVADACVDNVPNVTSCVYTNIYNFEEQNGYIFAPNLALAKRPEYT